MISLMSSPAGLPVRVHIYVRLGPRIRLSQAIRVSRARTHRRKRREELAMTFVVNAGTRDAEARNTKMAYQCVTRYRVLDGITSRLSDVTPTVSSGKTRLIMRIYSFI